MRVVHPLSVVHSDEAVRSGLGSGLFHAICCLFYYDFFLYFVLLWHYIMIDTNEQF